MKQILTIIFFSVVSVGAGYLLRTQKYEYDVRTASLESPAVTKQLTPNTRSFTAVQDDGLKAPPEPKKPTLALSAKILEQGDTLVVSVKHEEEIELRIQNRKIPLISVGPKKSVAIYGIDVRKEPSALAIALLKDGSVIQEEAIKIVKRNFPITELVLSGAQKEAGITPKEAAKEIIQNDNAKLYEVLDKPLPDIYIKEKFAYPLPDQIIVGGFGNIRKFGETEIRHLGVDLDAKRGDPVKAIQSGVVRLARNLSNYGLTIVIDHGAEIFSMYLHLNSMQTKEGENVAKGQIIGAVGNTGAYSLDPHLHLSIKTNNASVDPLRFIFTYNTSL